MTLAICAQSNCQRPDCGQCVRPHSGACRDGCEWWCFRSCRGCICPTFFPALSHTVNAHFKRMRKTCIIVNYFDIAITLGFIWWLFSKAPPHASDQLYFLVRDLVGIYFQSKEGWLGDLLTGSTASQSQDETTSPGCKSSACPQAIHIISTRLIVFSAYSSGSFRVLRMALPVVLIEL